MENADNGTELLENVVISDVPAPQYMIQRIPENTHLLGSELLQHSGGLVVDLGGTDFIPVTYPADGILPHDLTEEDRNLAAALVAVQLSQQQKQQQLHETLPTLVQNTNLGKLNQDQISFYNDPDVDAKLLEEHHQHQSQLVLTGTAGDKETLSNGYLHIVGSENVYIEKQALPKIVGGRFAAAITTTTTQQQNFNGNQIVTTTNDKFEDDKRGSDGENRTDIRTSRKSLPHKKRISRKLKKPLAAPQRVHQCNLCEQTFTSNDEFAQHEILCQTTITPVQSTFSCQLCSQTFQDQLRFFEHLKSHYEPNSTTNNNTNNQQSHLVTNSISKIETEEDKDNLFLLNLTCIQCNKTFRKQKVFDTHMKEVHQKEDMNEFSEPEDLMEGINVVVEDNEANSDNDTKAWYREDELHQTEEDLKELETQDNNICHMCKKNFPARSILVEHMMNCTALSPADNKKKQKKKSALHCTECDRVFTHRNSLVYHMKSHSGIRPHQCDQCGKSFFASSALKVHLRLHSGDKPYKCEDCGKHFRQWGDLRYHYTSIHSTEKQFQCEYCGKDFARKYSLIVHRRIHTGEKNYKCEFCGKTFRASSYLQNHRRIHTGEKPHECGVCGKPFRVRSDMKRHQKLHSKRAPPGKAVKGHANNTTQSDKPIKSESGSNISEDVYELNVEETPDAGQILGYDPEHLDPAVRDGANTLYTHGPQLFLVSYSDVPVKNMEAATTWIQTGS